MMRSSNFGPPCYLRNKEFYVLDVEVSHSRAALTPQNVHRTFFGAA